MNEIAEDNKRKPKLTVEEQIEHLKSKGVTFELCDEGEASRILSERAYQGSSPCFVAFGLHIQQAVRRIARSS